MSYGDNVPDEIHTTQTQEDERSEINFYHLNSQNLDTLEDPRMGPPSRELSPRLYSGSLRFAEDTFGGSKANQLLQQIKILKRDSLQRNSNDIPVYERLYSQHEVIKKYKAALLAIEKKIMLQKELAQCTFQPNSSLTRNEENSPVSAYEEEGRSSSRKKRTQEQFIKDNVERFLKQKADNNAKVAERIRQKKE